jgi:hypothetical protein
MKEFKEYEKDLASIRSMMERSVKFISLSGMSGIMAGVYALMGAALAYWKVYSPHAPLSYPSDFVPEGKELTQLILIALIVLLASIVTGFWLSNKKAIEHKMNLWNTTSKTLIINLAIPLATGGLFAIILLFTGHFGIVAPACLIFYGLALINASANLYEEVRTLAYCEIALGLISALLPAYGLLFWAVGFGALHIVYGGVMYYRYDK